MSSLELEKKKVGRKPLPETKKKTAIGLSIENWVYEALQEEAEETDFEGINPLIRSILREHVTNNQR